MQRIFHLAQAERRECRRYKVWCVRAKIAYTQRWLRWQKNNEKTSKNQKEKEKRAKVDDERQEKRRQLHALIYCLSYKLNFIAGW